MTVLIIYRLIDRKGGGIEREVIEGGEKQRESKRIGKRMKRERETKRKKEWNGSVIFIRAIHLNALRMKHFPVEFANKSFTLFLKSSKFLM